MYNQHDYIFIIYLLMYHLPVFLFYISCGLAVLAMATRTIRACEVAVGGAANGGSDNPYGIENTNTLNVLVRNSLENGWKTELKVNPNVHPISPPPTLAELQKKAVSLGFSGRGEMFSTIALACLADFYRKGRYNLTMMNRNLLNYNELNNRVEVSSDEDTHTNYEINSDVNEEWESEIQDTPDELSEMDDQIQEEQLYHHDSNQLPFNESMVMDLYTDYKVGDFTNPIDVSNTVVENIDLNFNAGNDKEQLLEPETDKEEINLSQENELHDQQMSLFDDKDLPLFDSFNPTSYNFKEHGNTLTMNLSDPKALMSVIQRLLLGHLIAVW